LINPQAGDGKNLALHKEITAHLQSRQIDFETWEGEWNLEPELYSHIYLIGGDGTLNYFINKFPDCKTPISLFNAGTGNDFFWKLYGSVSVNAQLETALSGEITAIDAGDCNGRLFLNGTGIGFDGSVVQQMQRESSFIKGISGYYAAVIKSIFSYRSKKVQVVFEPADIGRSDIVFMIAIANGSRYGGDFMIAPQACLTDGYLDFVSIGKVSVIKRLFYLPKMKKGGHLSLPFVYHSKVKSVSIRSEKPIAAHLDGELMISTSFQIKVLPRHFNFRR